MALGHGLLDRRQGQRIAAAAVISAKQVIAQPLFLCGCARLHQRVHEGEVRRPSVRRQAQVLRGKAGSLILGDGHIDHAPGLHRIAQVHSVHPAGHLGVEQGVVEQLRHALALDRGKHLLGAGNLFGLGRPHHHEGTLPAPEQACKGPRRSRDADALDGHLDRFGSQWRCGRQKVDAQRHAGKQVVEVALLRDLGSGLGERSRHATERGHARHRANVPPGTPHHVIGLGAVGLERCRILGLHVAQGQVLGRHVPREILDAQGIERSIDEGQVLGTQGTSEICLIGRALGSVA